MAILAPALSRRVTAGHGRAAFTAGVASLALALAGCALLPPPPKPQRSAHLPPKPHPVTSTAPSGSAAAAGALHHQPPPAAPPAAPVQVVGLSQDAVRRLLGPPAAEHAQGPAQTWTYEGIGCRVEIAFYYDVTRSGFFALSQQLAGGGDGETCLAQIHDARSS